MTWPLASLFDDDASEPPTAAGVLPDWNRTPPYGADELPVLQRRAQPTARPPAFDAVHVPPLPPLPVFPAAPGGEPPDGEPPNGEPPTDDAEIDDAEIDEILAASVPAVRRVSAPPRPPPTPAPRTASPPPSGALRRHTPWAALTVRSK